ncbi:MAG: C39 family peptidase [Candidatus Promineifilaceae bacterium]|nr:C39 family peptidase [Candidatus Promineifilaceae bacterium]
MRRTWLVILVLLILLTGALAWQLPAILKAVPSRYVARLPEPVQALGVREHVSVLPTAAAPELTDEELHQLLASAAPSAGAVPTHDPRLAPPTPTPPPTRAAETGANDAPGASPATAVPTATPAPAPTKTRPPLPASVRLQGIAHRFQDWNNCGPATLGMSLTYFDIYHTQNQIASIVKPDPEDRNVSPWEMAAYVNQQTEQAALDRANGDLYTVRALLSSGYPVIVEVGIQPPGEYRWMEWYGHYLLLVAYDDSAETFWVYDSWFGTSEVPQENAHSDGREISYAELDSQWRYFNRSYIVLYPPEEEAEVAAIIGDAMNDEQMWQNALRRTRTELEAEPEVAHLWFNLGTVYNALGNYEAAAAAFDKARSLALPWRMLWYQMGPYEAYYEIGRYEDVIELADVTLQDRPYFEEAFYYKGLAQIALGEEAAGRENLEKAAAFNPNFPLAAEALGD